jgi:hypothetical protein
MQATYNGPAREGWEPGVTYFVQTQAMSGKIYKDKKDKKGKPDTRTMVWRSDDGYNGNSHLITIETEDFKAQFNETY